MRVRWRNILASTTARFVAMLFVLQLLTTGGTLYYVQEASRATLLAEQRSLVSSMRDDLVAGFSSMGRNGLIELIDARLASVRTEIPALLLTTPNGAVLAGNVQAWPPGITPNTGWRTLALYRTGSSRLEHMGLIATSLPDGSRLLTGHVIQGDVRLMEVNEDVMLAAMLFSVPLTLLVALAAGRLIDRRVGQVAATAAAVGRGDFETRVAMTGGDDAFDRLGAAVNAMLDRIELLVSELRIVTDSLAHDLRSPLTRLKSTLERAMIETRHPDALQAMKKVSGEAETLLTMLTTALQISRVEAGIGRERFVETGIADLLGDLVEVYGPYVEEHGFSLACAAPKDLMLVLHRELLSQAIGNLIENATKYATGGRTIALTAEPLPDGVQLTIADNGPGIAPSQRAAALRRFGRLDPSRQISGFGLGLSLAEAVARLHKGRLELADNNPGLRVVLFLQRPTT